MRNEFSVERGACFGPRAAPACWVAAETPQHLDFEVPSATANPAGVQQDERLAPLSPPSGTDGAAPCERGAPAIWLLPCILGGGLIWASILLAVL